MGKHVTIHGRLWQDRMGNTYNTTTVAINGRHVLSTPITYGYGNQYAYIAWAALADAGHVPTAGEHEAPWRAAERAGFTLDYTCTHVGRKRDL